jgi:hypothetical protein
MYGNDLVLGCALSRPLAGLSLREQGGDGRPRLGI